MKVKILTKNAQTRLIEQVTAIKRDDLITNIGYHVSGNRQNLKIVNTEINELLILSESD